MWSKNSGALESPVLEGVQLVKPLESQPGGKPFAWIEVPLRPTCLREQVGSSVAAFPSQLTCVGLIDLVELRRDDDTSHLSSI